MCILKKKKNSFIIQGNIPKSVINWAAKTGVPAFIGNLKAACRQYEKEHPDGVPLPLDSSDVIQL